MESDEFYNHVSEKVCGFYYNTIFNNIDTSNDGKVGTLQNSLNKFCPFFKVICSHDNDKHKSWLTNKIKSLIKEKNRLHNKYLSKPLSYGHQFWIIRNRPNNMKKM